QARKEATTHLTEAENPELPATTRVKSSWQSRVSSQWQSTLEGFKTGPDPVLNLRLDRTGKTETLRLSELAWPARRGEEHRPRHAVLQHAYARTIHKAQGRTTDFAIIHAGDGLDASRAYVAMTRHRRDVLVVADAGAIAHRLASDGEKPTREAVRMAFLRSAKASAEGLNASDYVADRGAWLRTGDPKALPETARETRMQAVMRFAKLAAQKVGKVIRWRPERVRAIQPPEQAPAQARPQQPAPRQQARREPSKPRLDVPLLERMTRTYAVKVSQGAMGFSEAVDALVAADRRDAVRGVEIHWNPVHHIATPKGGRRARDPDFWTDRLMQRIDAFEQGGVDRLWPEVARMREQAKAQAARASQQGQAPAKGRRGVPQAARTPPPAARGAGHDRGPRMRR
ncbi:hypothetical protein LHA35_28255, partial [Roseicella sp. GB24]|nr:hypothetical protein [Roseicella aerolata]